MSSQDVVKAIMGAWEMRDLKATASLLADDFQVTGPASEALGKDAYLMFQAVHNEAFPDWKFNIREIQERGDNVHVTFQISATQTGAFDVSKLGLPVPAVPPTGKFRHWPVEHLTATIKNGKVEELEVINEPSGGVIGTLEWLGVQVPRMA